MKTEPPPADAEADQNPPATEPSADPALAREDLPPPPPSFRETIYYWLMARP